MNNAAKSLQLNIAVPEYSRADIQIKKINDLQEVLHKAILKDSSEEIREAVQSGANINMAKDGKSPLLFAILRLRYNAIEVLLKLGARPVDICGQYAEDEQDRLVLEQYRPYIIMMNCRAEASIHYNNKDYKPALEVAEKGLDRIRDFFTSFGQEEAFAKSNEVRVLKKFVREIRKKIPMDPLTRLRQQLDKALKTERYEEAAKLRDQIKRLQTSV